MFSGAMTLLAFWFLFDGLREGKRFKELTEYRDKRTINGITRVRFLKIRKNRRQGTGGSSGGEEDQGWRFGSGKLFPVIPYNR